MKVAVQQEDLQLLARTLQEQILAEVPSGEVFKIQCAVKKDELMILTEHPPGVTVDTEYIFVVLSEALQLSPAYKAQKVQCFIRIFGEKLPYAKFSLIMQQKEDMRRGIPLSSSLTYTPSTTEDEPEELFDSFVDTPDLWNTESERPVKSLLLGISLVAISVFSSAFYLVSRPCVMSECQEIQTAQRLNLESRQLMRRANSENQLVSIQQQLTTASTNLSVIPRWSSRYQQAEELKASLSMQSEKINQVVRALQTANMAEKKSQATANSLAELQDIQSLWRQAIAPLEAISPNSELYSLVQPRLSKFRVNLQAVNKQLLSQEQWVKKLNDAKAVADVAAKRETNAKTLNDWQQAQSTWQVVINALNIIPSDSPAYTEAQELLLEYKPQLDRTRDRATTAQMAARSYQQALTTANQAKTYAQRNQWQLAVTYWEQALQNAQQIPQDSLYYNQAQSLIEPYSAALQEAQEQLHTVNNLQQVSNDLNRTCAREIRICTFSINKTGIAVSLTPQYEQVLEALSEADLQTTNHWYILQEALGVIGDNVNLPVFIYDTQGQGIYTHIPQG